MRLIERDLLEKPDHEPTAHDLEIAKDAAELAIRLRFDAASGHISEDTWKAAVILDVFLGASSFRIDGPSSANR
jgi:hypothetical protein